FDAVGTARISSAIYDRVCRLAVDYQDAADEVAITGRHVTDLPDGVPERMVDLVRRTRTHPDLRIGSSVRGAIDFGAVASSLAQLRERPVTDRSVCLDAALVALSGRVRVREGCARDPESIITELWEAVFEPAESRPPEPGKATAPTGAATH
ncbi:MAG: MoxR family ATPase, partial [Acidimicrobiia bacterium]